MIKIKYIDHGDNVVSFYLHAVSRIYSCHMKSTVQLLLLCLLWLFLFVFPVIATRSLSITGNKTSLLGDEELTITASPSGFTDGETIYIKGAFSKADHRIILIYQKRRFVDKNSTSNTSQRSIKIGEGWNLGYEK